MSETTPFLLQDFWPYLLNRAAEATSLEFQKHYKRKYGILRTEWRVLFHLGRYGPLTSKSICNMANIHKTKVSRAVAALEKRRFITRQTMAEDRRHEVLTLTRTGNAAFNDLVSEAKRYNAHLMREFTADEVQTLRRMLIALSKPGNQS